MVEAEIRMVAAELERLHPNLFHTVSRVDFHGAVERLCAEPTRLSREEVLVGVMRLAALPGPRDGHTGLYPLGAEHARPLHLFPLRLWSFPEGFLVVRGELVGARLRAIEGTPVERLVERLDPCIGRDNEHSLTARLPEFLVTAEVLKGLGVTAEQGRARFELTTPDGATRVEHLDAVSAPEFLADLGDPRRMPPSNAPAATPLWLRKSATPHWVSTLADSQAVYAVYAATSPPRDGFLSDLLRRAGENAVQRVVVDLRRNGGGDNTTYGPLVDALSDPRIDRPGRLAVLVGRMTYSAAGNLAADLQRATGAMFVGEPTGGSPHQYGDSVPVPLPELGVTVRVATLYHGTAGGAEDERLAVEPGLLVPLTADDWLAGRDPVLAAALRL